MRDYNAARYDLAAGEFQDVIHYYPLDDMAGSAQFYLGEIAYRQKKYDDAVKDYNAVLEGFSGNAKAPAAQLHKALALLQAGQAFSRRFTNCARCIQRYPRTPEAAQAREKLNAHGSADQSALKHAPATQVGNKKSPARCGAFLLAAGCPDSACRLVISAVQRGLGRPCERLGQAWPAARPPCSAGR